MTIFRQLRFVVVTLLIICVLAFSSFSPLGVSSVSAQAVTQNTSSKDGSNREDPSKRRTHKIEHGTPELPRVATRQQQPIWPSKRKKAGSENAAFAPDFIVPSAIAAATPSSPRDAKLLVISADGTETDLPAIKSFLQTIGIPFDVFTATQRQLTSALLTNGTKSFYQGVILVTGNLLYFDQGSNQYVSAFDDTEWATLWAYEAAFGIRQVTSYTFPYGWPENYGLQMDFSKTYYQDTLVTPLTATLTTQGQQIFWYLNGANPITIKGAWTYFATVISPAVTTPLLVTPQGYALASINTYTNGRQSLSVTIANNPFLLHSMLLSYGVINWVTKGLFLGERHVNMDVQVDDLFIDTDLWNPALKCSDNCGLVYRNDATDITALVNWQNRLKTNWPVANQMRLEWAFNGEGTSGIYIPDTLTPAIQANRAQFNFVNHTYTHLNLDAATRAEVTNELNQNHAVATQMSLTNYFKDAMVQPDISGLTNTNFFNAANSFGIRYIIADTSRPGWSNPTPNAGFYKAGFPNILIIPRRPTNLFYPVSTQAEWVDMYNCYYSIPNGTCANRQFVYWDHDLTYAEILDKESDIWLSYLLKWDLDPLMFHVGNVRAYNGVNNLLGDLIEATLTKYRFNTTLNIRNLQQHNLGVLMAQRMNFDAAGLTATITPCVSIAIRATRAALVPVTGVINGTNREVYGGQNISYISFNAGQTKTIALPACTAAANALSPSISPENVMIGTPDVAPPASDDVPEPSMSEAEMPATWIAPIADPLQEKRPLYLPLVLV